MIELVEVSRTHTRAAAEQQALVLAAVGISSQVVVNEADVALCVWSFDARRARRELALYAQENAPVARKGLPATSALHRIEGALSYVAILLLFFAVQRRDLFSIDWVAAGSAHAGLILDGAWWRTITALTLHIDFDHLLGNLTFGAIAGFLVAKLVGTGLGWFAILLAGALGNGINAVFHSASHTSIGASTAVFGALGILSGYTWTSSTLRGRGGLRRWAPIGAGIMLLAFLGFNGERTDIGAHVLGFVMGGVLGFAIAHAGRAIPHGDVAQRVYGTLALGLVALAWFMALTAGR